MNNKDSIRVVEERIIPDYEFQIKKYKKEANETWWKPLEKDLDALTHLISLAKDYEQAKSGLPEEQNAEFAEKDLEQAQLPKVIRLLAKQVGFNACLHQVTLSRVKFKKELKKIICGNCIVTNDGLHEDCPGIDKPQEEMCRAGEKLSQAILSEMGGE